MSSFVCPVCYTILEFTTFSKFFRHITLYHQNEPEFRMTCNLNATCGVSYRTYSAYKSHIYRRHVSQLYLSEPSFHNISISCTNNNEQDVDLPVDSNFIYDDYNNVLFYIDNDILLDLSTYENKKESARTTASLLSTRVQENPSVSILDIKRSYTSFIMQLGEEFFYRRVLLMLFVAILLLS